jgi:carbonic anhydrase
MHSLNTSPVIEELTSRNEEFAAQHDVAAMTMMPALRTMVISCVDPRVDPAAVLGLQLGDAIVIRNVGGRVTPAVLRTLGLLAQIARRNGFTPGDGWNLVVVHHTDCGITQLTDNLEALAAELETTTEALDLKTLTDPRASLAADLSSLRANQRLPRGLIVSGLLYNTGSGRVETAVAPTVLGAA